MTVYSHLLSNSQLYLRFKKWIERSPMVLFTHKVKKIKGAAHKNGNIDSMCKRAFTLIDNLSVSAP